MSLKSEIHCPTSDTAKKVTVESEITRLNKRQQRRKLKLLDDQYIKDLQTEQEYKEELSRDMENDYKHRHCDCIICDTAHELFKNDPQKFLEERWQDYLEQVNREPCTDEELDASFAKYGLVLNRETGEVSSV